MVGPGVEKPDVQRFFLVQFGKEDGVGMLLGIVVVVGVAGEAAQQDALVVGFPSVDGHHDEALVDGPGVGQGGHEGRVNHVPLFAVVLLLFAHDGVEGGAGFAHGEGAEFGENVRLRDARGVAVGLDLGDDFPRHVVVVVLEIEGVFDGETAADVERAEGGADFFQLNVEVHALQQLVPIVGGVVDAGVDEEVQHVQLHVGVVRQVAFVVGEDFLVAQAQTGGVEFKFGLFFGGNPDAYFEFWGVRLQLFGQQGELLAVVQDGDDVDPSVVDQSGNILQVLSPFVAVADHVVILADLAFFVQRFDEVDVKSTGRFQVDVVLEGLFQHKTEVAALGAVTEMVASLVIHLRHGHVEHALGSLDVGTDLGQVGHLQGSPILLDEFHEGNVVPVENSILNVELFLRPFEGLLNQVQVVVFHRSNLDVGAKVHRSELDFPRCSFM